MYKFLVSVGILLTFVATGAAPQAAAQDAATKKLLDALRKEINAEKDLSDKVKAFAIKSLLPHSTNAVFVKETLAQNAKKMALDEIKKIDEQWIKAESMLPIQQEKLNNACAAEVKKILARIPAVLEAFVMDDQGGVVGENNLTSDYWQGDEDKWINSFNGGKGGVDIGKAKFDKSANATLQQISLPLIAKGGKVVGAITWGVAIDKL
jgi:predicted HNH restriction endonuclease